MSEKYGIFLHVPLYVKAKTPDELTKAMIRNNMQHGMAYKYFDIQKVGNSWFAWYYADANNRIKIKSADDG